jgi:RNA polymerase sigma-70 factor (ECF subfamily)
LLPETRHSMIARLANQADIATWLQFLRVYQAAILRYCRARGLRDSDAEEVCQDVALALARQASDWEKTGRSGSFRAWLFETARRLCLKRIRDDQSFVSLDAMESEIPDAGEDAEETLVGQESDDHRDWLLCAAAGIVQAEVASETWQAFWRTTVDGIAPADVATEMGVGVGSVYTSKCRVIARLRRCVTELDESSGEK